MMNRFVMYGCICFFMTAGLLGFSSDASASRRFNPEDIQKQMEASGVNPDELRSELESSGATPDSSETREERLEALRNERGNTEDVISSKSPADIEIPTGTHIMVKLDSSLDSSEMGEGEQFTGRLQGDLVVDNVLMASDGSKVYGKITASERARNVAGTSAIEFKLTGLLIEKQMRSVESSLIRVESQGSGRMHAKATIDAGTVVEFSIGEPGSDVGTTETISGPDKKATDRVDERREERRHRRD